VQLIQAEYHSYFLFKVDVFPPLTLLQVATFPQLLSCGLVELSRCLQHLRGLHHTVEKADFAGWGWLHGL
jgi:hypothetical protein